MIARLLGLADGDRSGAWVYLRIFFKSLAGPSRIVSSRGFDVFRFFHLIVCGNQGRLTQYLYLVSRKHRDLKDRASELEPNLSALRELALELSRYSRQEFFSAAERNFDLLRSYYSETGRAIPRLCIKGNFLKDGVDHVITVFRDSAVKYDGGYDISSNSGFLHCLETGQYYLNNDLPGSALKGRYKNPRLDENQVHKIASSVLMARQKTVSANWSMAWRGGEDAASAYKSTLIVPMTLWNNELSSEFLEKYGAEDAERLIFGFLCFDSIEEDFFNKHDIDLGYVFADFLALFSYAMFNYTDYSNTFKRVRSDVKDKFGEFHVVAPHIPSSDVSSIGVDVLLKATRNRKSENNSLIYFSSIDEI